MDREEYLHHPEHLRVVKEVISPILADNGAIVFDYA
jgi:hypothetical protein